MYQFTLIPDSEKGEAVKKMFNFLLELQSPDGLIAMNRPMELISITKL